MRKLIVFATISFMGAGSHAWAQSPGIKDCSQGSPERRLVCLQENIKLLDQLLSQRPKLDNIVIQWADHPNSCIVYMGNNLLEVRDTCTDPNRNRFVIRPYQ